MCPDSSQITMLLPPIRILSMRSCNLDPTMPNSLHHPRDVHNASYPPEQTSNKSVSGLVVKSIVAIDGPRVRFAADATTTFSSDSVPARLAQW